MPAAAGIEGVLVLLDDDRTTVTVTSAALDGSGTMTARGFDEPTTDSTPVRTTVASRNAVGAGRDVEYEAP